MTMAYHNGDWKCPTPFYMEEWTHRVMYPCIPLPPDADNVEVGYAADLQLEAELGQSARVVDLAPQDVPLLLALDTLHTVERLLL